MRRACSRTRHRRTTAFFSCRRWSNETRSGSFDHPRASGARPGDLEQEGVDGRDLAREDGAEPVIGPRFARARWRLSPGHDGVIVANLTSLTLAEARDGLRAKKFSAREITQAHVAAIERARNLNAFVLETPELALEM